MKFSSVQDLASAGFRGFSQVRDLQADGCASVPATPGVYLVIRAIAEPPTFRIKSVGGWLKQRDPTVSAEELKANWVPEAIILNVGKAGGAGSSATLRSRLSQYMKFGQGKPIGHWGGRLVWQLADHLTLQVCWRPVTDQEPATIESQLIQEFRELYRKRPFANLQG